MRIVYGLLAVTAILSACASPQAIPNKYDISENDRYVPINLKVDAGRYVTNTEAEVVSYIDKSFNDSGLFTNIETSFIRWPFTIKLTYTWEQSIGAGEFLGSMASAATLLIVPTSTSETHTIVAEIIYGSKTVKKLTYTEEIKTALSLYHKPIEDRKTGMNLILDRFFADLENQELLPRIRDCELNKNPLQEVAPEKRTAL